MSGTVKAGAPWLRRAIAELGHQHPTYLAAIERAIPDEHHVTLICGRAARPLGAVLVGPDGEVARVDPRYPTVGDAVYGVLAKAAEVAA